jgi:hypothetical protein
MVHASYPLSRGIIMTDPGDYATLPRFNTVNTSGEVFMSDCVDIMLEVSALASDADPAHEEGVSSVMYNQYMDKSGQAVGDQTEVASQRHSRPSAFDDLIGVCAHIENYVVMHLNSINAGVASMGCHGSLPRGTFDKYFENDSVDSHFVHFEFLPYMFVEPAGLIKHEACVRQPGPKAGAVRELDLFPSQARFPPGSDASTTRNHKHRSTNLYYEYKDCSLRDLGFYYLAASQFNGGRDKGLGSMRFVCREAVRDSVTMMRASTTCNLNEMRWTRPQCPVPAPGEGRAWGGKVMLEYSGGLGRSLYTASSAKVSLEVGDPVLSSVKAHNMGTSNVSRDINDKYRKYLNDFDLSKEEYLLDFLFAEVEESPVVRHNLREAQGDNHDSVTESDQVVEANATTNDTTHAAPREPITAATAIVESTETTNESSVSGGDVG